MQSLQNNRIRRIRPWCVRNAYTMAFILLLACFFGYSIGGIYGFSIYPDEFGYWVHAAVAAGCDWSGIASLNSYYSYGYGFILFPVFVLFQDGVAAYRAAVAVNFALLAGVFLMLRRLAGGLFADMDRRTPSVLAAVAALYPPALMYAKTTMAETLLAFLYVLACVLLYRYLECRRASRLVLFLAVLVYMHFVHMRTVSVLAAGILTLLYDGFHRVKGGKGRAYLSSLAVMIAAAALFAAGMAAKDMVSGRIYGSRAEIFRVNDYEGQIGKLRYVTTPEGMGNLVVSMAGKMLYLGLATFGTAFWGLRHALKTAVHGRGHRERAFWFFILMSAAGAVAVSAVYTVRPGRVDALAYGRYHEYMFPILMLAGLYAMWRTPGLWKGTLLAAVSGLPLLGAVLYSLRVHGQTDMHACMVFGMGYLYDAGDFEPSGFYVEACIFGVLLTLALALLVSLVRKKENRTAFLFLAAAAETALAVQLSAAVTDTGSIGAYRDAVIADRITYLTENADAGRVLYLDSGGDSAVGIIQFLLRDTEITVLDRRGNVDDYTEEEMGSRDMVLMDYRDDYGGELGRRYTDALSSGHFVLYYNR